MNYPNGTDEICVAIHVVGLGIKIYVVCMFRKFPAHPCAARELPEANVRFSDLTASQATLSRHPEELAKQASRRMKARLWPHGSLGDAKHRPETALARLLTMRVLTQ